MSKYIEKNKHETMSDFLFTKLCRTLILGGPNWAAQSPG